MKPIINLDDGIFRPLQGKGNLFYGLARTHAMVELYNLNLNPDYQRGNVWSNEQQENFIGHLLEGGNVPHIILNEVEDNKFEILDGKQRVTASLEWCRGCFPAKLSDNRLIYYSQIEPKRILKMEIGMFYTLTTMSRKQCLEYYIKLNRGGTIHTVEEINKVKELLSKEM